MQQSRKQALRQTCLEFDKLQSKCKRVNNERNVFFKYIYRCFLQCLDDVYTFSCALALSVGGSVKWLFLS